MRSAVATATVGSVSTTRGVPWREKFYKNTRNLPSLFFFDFFYLRLFSEYILQDVFTPKFLDENQQFSISLRAMGCVHSRSRCTNNLVRPRSIWYCLPWQRSQPNVCRICILQIKCCSRVYFVKLVDPSCSM